MILLQLTDSTYEQQIQRMSNRILILLIRYELPYDLYPHALLKNIQVKNNSNLKAKKQNKKKKEI